MHPRGIATVQAVRYCSQGDFMKHTQHKAQPHGSFPTHSTVPLGADAALDGPSPGLTHPAEMPLYPLVPVPSPCPGSHQSAPRL